MIRIQNERGDTTTDFRDTKKYKGIFKKGLHKIDYIGPILIVTQTSKTDSRGNRKSEWTCKK